MAYTIDDLARTSGGRVAGPSLLVLNELDAGNHADARNIANQRMPGKLQQAIEHAATYASTHGKINTGTGEVCASEVAVPPIT